MVVTEGGSFNPCVLSSLIFLTNAHSAIMTDKCLYSVLFVLLTTSSVINHWNTSPLKQTIDKICVYAVVLYGLYVFMNKKYSIGYQVIILMLFISTVILYNIGKYTCTMCFDPDDNVKYMYHVLMHILASLGHHLIILL